MSTIPPWIAGAIVAVLGYVGAWAALRVTVARLKDDVRDGDRERARDREQLIALQAAQVSLTQALAALVQEVSRVREFGHETRNRMQEIVPEISERVAVLEARSEED